MRAVRAVGNSNRAVVVTIHQPSIEIFETFDNLLLLQVGELGCCCCCCCCCLKLLLVVAAACCVLWMCVDVWM
jgi:hypothetical protein